MKWTTANIKSPNYSANHEIYVGSMLGSFKRLMPACEKNPYAAKNLQELCSLNADSRINALTFGSEENSDILIGRGNSTVQLYSLRSASVERTFKLQSSPVVGAACCGSLLIAGFSNGDVQCVPLEKEEGKDDECRFSFSSGNDIAHLRQCSAQRNLVATGGKGLQNNLKVFDIESEGKLIFTSKNLPNDYLQLAVPVWDSDIGFIDSPHLLATCSRHGYVRVYDTRKQRRPVQHFASEDQMSFTSLAANGNYIYSGTTKGAMKAFDIRRMKTFVHTYKGFTGSISDVTIDATGKYLTTASLDRYVRVHHADSCVLLYQCYVKSKALRVLLRDSSENPNIIPNAEEEQNEDAKVNKRKKKNTINCELSEDEEYDEMFDNMQTVCENANDNEELIDDSTKLSNKRKNTTKTNKNKKKKIDLK